MKSFSKYSTIFGRFPSSRAAILMAIILSAGGINLRAQQSSGNLASAQNGAFVCYSTPLAKGASANTLIDRPTTNLSFSKKSEGKIIVVDLGKPSKLGAVKLNFSGSSKIKVYVLKNPPKGNDWSGAIAGVQPNAVIDSPSVPAQLDGVEGEFLVLICDADPGRFSNLVVTGNYFVSNDYYGAGFFGPTLGQSHEQALAETPYLESAFGSPPSRPSVPPVSH